jgi:CheY-like chemotaxis protein
MTILIADQNPGFRKAVKNLLQVDEKVKMVWEADDGEIAVELAREHRPDLIFMDMSLPRVNGLEATRMIKKFGANVQVIMMGEYTAPVYRRAAIQSGADAFIEVNAWARYVRLPLICGVDRRRDASRAVRRHALQNSHPSCSQLFKFLHTITLPSRQ